MVCAQKFFAAVEQSTNDLSKGQLMTNPNYPYGEPNSGGSGQQNPFENNGQSPYSQYQSQGGGNTQDPYNSTYDGGFENSPLNAEKNTAAGWALGLGIAALACLLAVFTIVGSFLIFVSPILAIAGIIVAIVALAKAKNFHPARKRKGFAITGMVLSIISLILAGVMAAFAVYLLGSSGLVECAEYDDPAAQQQCVQDIVNGN